jgi:hypothetical protein
LAAKNPDMKLTFMTLSAIVATPMANSGTTKLIDVPFANFGEPERVMRTHESDGNNELGMKVTVMAAPLNPAIT